MKDVQEFIGSNFFFIIISLVLFWLLGPLLVGLLILTCLITLGRLFVFKKRKAQPKIVRFGFLDELLTELQTRSFISGHVARIVLIFTVLSLHYHLSFLLGILFGLALGGFRVKKGFHDWTDVFGGIIIGIYSGISGYFFWFFMFLI